MPEPYAAIRIQLQKERDKLLSLLARRSDSEHHRDEGFVPPATHGQDDEAERVVDLEMGIMTKGNLQEALQDVDAALKRLDEGTYSLCQTCGQPIGEKRLLFAPAAKYCITCQMKHEVE